MVIPLISGAMLDMTAFYGAVAHVAGAVYVWATHRTERSPADDVQDMLRKPVRWSLTHPIQGAVRLVRKADRRQAQ